MYTFQDWNVPSALACLFLCSVICDSFLSQDIILILKNNAPVFFFFFPFSLWFEHVAPCVKNQTRQMFNLTFAWSLWALPQEIAFPKMVASCCRFLCYFCRISRQNQKAMFDHLSYLLENSSVGLGGYARLPRVSIWLQLQQWYCTPLWISPLSPGAKLSTLFHWMNTKQHNQEKTYSNPTVSFVGMLCKSTIYYWTACSNILVTP